jgi:hypothetical protein
LDVAQQTEKARLAFGRLKAWGREQRASIMPKPKPESRAAQVVALNALRKNAKGDQKVPMDKRLYLHVEAEAKTAMAKFPKGDLFFNAEWSVGRVLDAAAKSLQVQNMNNSGKDEEKLRVFHIESGRLLEFGEKIGEGVANGNTIVLLRGLEVPDLITL